MDKDQKKKVGIIVAALVLVGAIIAYIIHKDDKTLNERFAQFKEAVKRPFAQKDSAQSADA